MPLRQEFNGEGSVARPTSTNAGEYAIIETIVGKGATSVVKMARHSRTDEPAAVKMVNIVLYAQYFEHELNALSVLNHKNIVKLLHYDRSNGSLFLEYLPFPSFFDYVQNFGCLSDSVAFKILEQIVDGFKHMHSLGLSHQDFKPENVCYNHLTQEIKILDFGLSLLSEEGVSNCVGSPLYMAPEIHLQKPYDRFKADIWSIGICFYEILTGDTPFGDCVDIDDLVDRLLFDQEPIQVPSHISTGASFLLKRMLTRDPQSRISLDSVVDLLVNRNPSS